MSHEIRTPLTSIQGFAEMLGDTLDGEPEMFARRIHRSSQRLHRTLDSLLQVSMLEAGEKDFEQENLAFEEVAQEAIQDIRRRAPKESPEVEMDAPGTETVVRSSEGALRRVCRNLIENAIKFTPEEGQVQVRVEAKEGKACLAVEDTGIGIAPDAVADLFEAFRQESRGIDREYEGVGLGLTVVKMLVDRLGGTIDIESEKGTGTTVEVWLPCVTSPGQDTSTSEDETSPHGGD